MGKTLTGGGVEVVAVVVELWWSWDGKSEKRGGRKELGFLYMGIWGESCAVPVCMSVQVRVLCERERKEVFLVCVVCVRERQREEERE